MTTWSVPAVATYAARSGWRGSDLHYAVAVAVAASGGADHYRQNPTTLPGSERRGLFALRVDQLPDDATPDLYDPQTNADMARVFYRAVGDWGWHPVHVSGAATNALDYVKASLASGARRISSRAAGPSWEDSLANALYVANRVGSWWQG